MRASVSRPPWTKVGDICRLPGDKERGGHEEDPVRESSSRWTLGNSRGGACQARKPRRGGAPPVGAGAALPATHSSLPVQHAWHASTLYETGRFGTDSLSI